MKTKIALFTVGLITLGACKTPGGYQGRLGKRGQPRLRGSNDVYPVAPAVAGETPTGKNIIPITVNGELCGPKQAPNQACVSVTICEPGTSNCQTIKNLLLDTGSVGIRLFASVVTLKLPPIRVEQGEIAECIGFADQSSQWGPIVEADIKLAEEPTIKLPMQLINSAYAQMPGPCSIEQSVPDVSPAQTGFNGIFGVGLFKQDYPAVNSVVDSPFYACKDGKCTQIVYDQGLKNPVASLPQDNNGVLIKLPAIGEGGATSASGVMILGIGTQENNAPGGLTAYPVRYPGLYAAMFTPYSSRPVSSFIDSGTNHLVLPKIDVLPLCDEKQAFVCPASAQNFYATTMGSGGKPTGEVKFQIANAASLLNSDNMVFATLGARGTDGLANVIDWGLPFFFGRTVAIGFEGKKSPLGSGMYWAY
ncbi:MAG: DUF3443 family protein [Deltaproteobacteria bacterium]|nr:DUF3443 family protein [Deltaproteobacteria bacterium]